MSVPTSLASILQGLVDAVRMDLSPGFTVSVSTTIGNPNQVDAIDTRSTHYLNFFFYDLAPSSFDPGMMPSQPLLLRTHCLVTPFALKENDETSVGHNDLVLLGDAIRVFHETPVRQFGVLDHAGVEQTYQIQAHFHPLTPEQMNQIWTILGSDVVYHTSVAYEISLAPVLLSKAHVGSPLTGAIGLDVHGEMEGATAPPSGMVHTPVVTPNIVDTRSESWVPAICFVHQNICVQSLSFALGSAELMDFNRQVWVAGKPGTEVCFFWEVWESGVGWNEIDSGQCVPITQSMIDPEAVEDAQLISLISPVDDAGEPILERAGQAVLYAQRTYLRGSDQTQIKVRSNPLLISIFGTGSPP